jgi:tetratricopeptide (TPR) repeat protein
MPEKNFMVVDARADHSFRVPRPDLSLALGSPNACTQCHQDQNDTWAAAAIEKWYPASPRRKKIHYGEALHAGRIGSINANQLLIDLANDSSKPAIARATAASLLQGYLNSNTLSTINDLLHDEDAIVRFSSINAAEGFPPQIKVKLLKHLLQDNQRMLRIEAARALADSQEHFSTESLKAQFDQALDEYITAQYVNAERPEAHANLGVLHTRMQKIDLAQREFEQAIAIDPSFIPAYINLADLYRTRGLDGQGKHYLETAIEKRPDAGSAHHALGLLYVRQNKLPEALSSLKMAMELEPQNTRYKYVYAVALDSTGQSEQSLEVLKHAHEQRPADRDVLYALISFHQKAGDLANAKHYANILIQVSPWDRNAHALLKSL